jgi:hypothetical protein
MVSGFFSNFYIFFFSKSIFIFQKWTKINVQKPLLQNNVGISKNVAFYIINGQSGLKRSDLRLKATPTFGKAEISIRIYLRFYSINRYHILNFQTACTI